MIKTATAFLIMLLLINCSEKGTAAGDDFELVLYDAVDVSKSNNTRLYMHYMPWFESKEINGAWGIHWTMANQNPDIVDNEGRRQIASHLYPLIGPYASKDKDVIEYHLLLMKLAGIDGLLIDWYGSFDIRDYGRNRINSEALIDRLDETGLSFAVVYEEYTAEHVAGQGQAETAIAAARADLNYLQTHYFNSDLYIQQANEPLLLTFGPRYFQTENDWTQIFSEIDPKPHFLTLWYESSEAGANGNGEFAWVYRNNMADLDNFYDNRAPVLQTAMGSAYPGFYDFYEEGGWGDQIGWQISYNGTATLSATLERAGLANTAALQLVTWNDFGEGTTLEPTVEFGFSFLETIQQFSGVAYNLSDLELVHQLYQYRKQYAQDVERQLKLDQVFYYLVSLQLDKAAKLMADIP